MSTVARPYVIICNLLAVVCAPIAASAIGRSLEQEDEAIAWYAASAIDAAIWLFLAGGVFAVLGEISRRVAPK